MKFHAAARDQSRFKHDEETVWQRLNRLLFLLIALVFIIAVIVLFREPMLEQRQQQARVEALQAQIAEQKALLDRQTREVDLLQNDPAFIETIARDKLDLMKEGEKIFRLESAPSPVPEPQRK